MWILPKNLITSHFVTDTEALTLVCKEFSDLPLEPLLFARSKPLASKMLWRKWNKGELKRLRSGLILKHSLGRAFAERWISSLEDTHASHSAPQESEQVKTTRDTFGRGLQREFPFANPRSASSKMLKGTFRLDSPQSSAIWRKLVTDMRREYSARRKLALHTGESGCLFWPTATVNESKNSEGKSQWKRNTPPLGTIVHGQPDREKLKKSGNNQECADPCDIKGPLGESLLAGADSPWPTPSVCGNHNRKGMSATSGDGLSTAVKNWATPNTLDSISPRTPAGILKQAIGARAGRSSPANLREQVDPVSCDIYQSVKIWPTPRGNKVHPEMKESNRAILANRNKSNLEEEIAGYCGNKTGKLNPRWVAQLMGVPTDWVYPAEDERNRTDELRMLGNGVVPATAAKAFVTLLISTTNQLD